jgi:hypothetical protein
MFLLTTLFKIQSLHSKCSPTQTRTQYIAMVMLNECDKYDFWCDPISMGKLDVKSEPSRINQLLTYFQHYGIEYQSIRVVMIEDVKE